MSVVMKTNCDSGVGEKISKFSAEKCRGFLLDVGVEDKLRNA